MFLLALMDPEWPTNTARQFAVSTRVEVTTNRIVLTRGRSAPVTLLVEDITDMRSNPGELVIATAEQAVRIPTRESPDVLDALIHELQELQHRLLTTLDDAPEDEHARGRGAPSLGRPAGGSRRARQHGQRALRAG